MQTIKITDIENIKIGHAEDSKNATGCSVIICEKGAFCGLDVRGGGPASRESELLKPTAAAEKIHAVVLSGGSAFGLDAAGGVMQYLEERDIGFDVGVTKVPLVVESCIFDLTVGNKNVRPTKEMGYEATMNAYTNKILKWGNVGAGCGASVGKLKGMDYAMKSGIGSYAIQIGELKIGAIVCVNALGDIYDYKENRIIAGMLNETQTDFANTYHHLIQSYEAIQNRFVSNTTIGVIITNAKFDKTKMNKVAQMAQNGYARSINPVHTSADGDSIYAMSVGEIEADLDVVGTIAQQVMSEAIMDAVKQAEDAYGLPSYKNINKCRS